MQTIGNARQTEAQESTIDVRWPRAGVAQLVLVGEHDVQTASELEGAAQALTAFSSELILDLRQARFIDCSVIQAAMRMKLGADDGGVRFSMLVGANGIVRRVLDVAGVLPVLNPAESLEDVLGLAPRERQLRRAE